jgi:hypothetical protein
MRQAKFRKQTALVESWKDYYQQAYAAAEDNSGKQSWAEYWDAVEKFLLTEKTGKFERAVIEKILRRPFRGWLDLIEEVLKKVAGEATQAEFRPRLEELGKKIAGEWAKESGARRIHTRSNQGEPNLETWLEQLETATGRETGDGREIEKVIKAISRSVERALR